MLYSEKPLHTLQFLSQKIQLGSNNEKKTYIVRNFNEESVNTISTGRFKNQLWRLMLKLIVQAGQISITWLFRKTANLIKTSVETMPVLFQLTPTLFTCWSKTTPFLPVLYRSFVCSAQHAWSSTLNYFSRLSSCWSSTSFRRSTDHNYTWRNDAFSSSTLMISPASKKRIYPPVRSVFP